MGGKNQNGGSQCTAGPTRNGRLSWVSRERCNTEIAQPVRYHAAAITRKESGRCKQRAHYQPYSRHGSWLRRRIWRISTRTTWILPALLAILLGVPNPIPKELAVSSFLQHETSTQ